MNGRPVLFRIVFPVFKLSTLRKSGCKACTVRKNLKAVITRISGCETAKYCSTLVFIGTNWRHYTFSGLLWGTLNGCISSGNEYWATRNMTIDARISAKALRCKDDINRFGWRWFIEVAWTKTCGVKIDTWEYHLKKSRWGSVHPPLGVKSIWLRFRITEPW